MFFMKSKETEVVRPMRVLLARCTLNGMAGSISTTQKRLQPRWSETSTKQTSGTRSRAMRSSQTLSPLPSSTLRSTQVFLSPLNWLKYASKLLQMGPSGPRPYKPLTRPILSFLWPTTRWQRSLGTETS